MKCFLILRGNNFRAFLIWEHEKIKVNWSSIVEGNLKAPFSLVIFRDTQERTWLLSQDYSTYSWSLLYNAECLASGVQSNIFRIFDMTWRRIEPWSPNPLANHLSRKKFLIHKDAVIAICLNFFYFFIHPKQANCH